MRHDDWKEDSGSSYGGFQYRWNYDEYQKSLQRRRKKAAGRGLRAFCVTASFVFLLSFVSFAAVLFTALSHGIEPPEGAHDDFTGFSAKKAAVIPAPSEEDDHTPAKHTPERDAMPDKTDDRKNNELTSADSRNDYTAPSGSETDVQESENIVVRPLPFAEDTAADSFYDEEPLPDDDPDTTLPMRLGIIVSTVTEDDAVLFRVPRGIMIEYADPDSVGAVCGLCRGDIIRSVNYVPITDAETFDMWEQTAFAGKTVLFSLFRDGEDCELSVTLPKESVSDMTEEAETAGEDVPLYESGSREDV